MCQKDSFVDAVAENLLDRLEVSVKFPSNYLLCWIDDIFVQFRLMRSPFAGLQKIISYCIMLRGFNTTCQAFVTWPWYEISLFFYFVIVIRN